jgi:hypothetical protein
LHFQELNVFDFGTASLLLASFTLAPEVIGRIERTKSSLQKKGTSPSLDLLPAHHPSKMVATGVQNWKNGILEIFKKLIMNGTTVIISSIIASHLSGGLE